MVRPFCSDCNLHHTDDQIQLATMRPLIVLLVITAALIAAISHEPRPGGSLTDLRSNAVALLKQADGVAKVERLVAVDRPKHRIIHIRDWHTLPLDLFAADLRDQDESIGDEEVERLYAESLAATSRVQASQRKLLRWLGVRRVYLEGLTDRDMPAYLALVRAVGRRGADVLPPHFGAPAQALVAGEIDEICPAEDETAFEAAGHEARELVFEGPANLDRERAIVRRLMADEVSLVVLGGDHDLSDAVPAGVEYLRVTVAGWAGD
jgi:hypothetical protein